MVFMKILERFKTKFALTQAKSWFTPIRSFLHGIRKGTSELQPRAECIEKIEQLLKKCRQNGALIWYMGHGQKNIGNWCFKDGEITLDEIIKLYTTYFSGKLLYLISDCCYSGQWVRRMADIMDHWKVETCGHQAKRRNALIKVAALANLMS